MTHEIRPLIPVPELTKEDQIRIYKKLMTQPIPSNIRNQEDYILLEAKQHGSYSYPDLLVSMHRLGLTNEVEQAADVLGLKVSNTAQEQDGHQYIGNIQHEQAINLVKESSYIPLNLRLFVDFLKEIKQGLNGKKVYDGNKNIIPSDRLLITWNEITEVRNPWRAEWLDNKFIQEGKQYYTIYHKINPNGTLKLVKEPLEECLMKDKTPGIDLEDWLERATNHGLPLKDVKSGSLYYWHPENDAVAGFDTISGGSYFLCGRDHGLSGSSFGVRRARKN